VWRQRTTLTLKAHLGSPSQSPLQNALKRFPTDHDKRVALYEEAQQMMHDQAPAVFIAHSTIFEPVRKEVSGYEVDPFGKHIFYQTDIKE